MKTPITSQPPPKESGNGCIDTATFELLANWRVQDATTDPEQIRAAEQALADFKKANGNRIVTGEPVLFSLSLVRFLRPLNLLTHPQRI